MQLREERPGSLRELCVNKYSSWRKYAISYRKNETVNFKQWHLLALIIFFFACVYFRTSGWM
jgi:hypothetical protein